MQYLSDIQDQIVSRLENKLGSDARIEPFYSDDIREVAIAMRDELRVDRFPHVLVTVNRSDEFTDLGSGTDTREEVSLICWTLSQDARKETSSYTDAEKFGLLTRAYLAGYGVATDFTNYNDFEDWSFQLEFENDEHEIYSVRASTILDIDFQKVITDYESS